MQWMVPFRRLGEEQLTVLNACAKKQTSKLWIQGFAGSGKTVILVHALRQALADDPGCKVCVVVYTHALKELVADGLRGDHEDIPVMTYFQFLSERQHYDLVVLDEVQDLPQNDLSAVSRFAKRLIVAGDTDQSIYEDRVSGDDIDALLAPEKHRLTVLYRLTDKIRKIVRAVLPRSTIESARISRMADVDVTLANAESERQEIAWVWYQAQRYADTGNPAAILIPSHRKIRRFVNAICDGEDRTQPSWERLPRGNKPDYGLVNTHLDDIDLPLRYLGNNFGSLAESDERPLTYVMTYHSAKGLDFETVFLPGLKQRAFFARDEALASRLFFVAATRSRRNLFFSYSGVMPHEYVQRMPQQLLNKVDCEIDTEEPEDDFHF